MHQGLRELCNAGHWQLEELVPGSAIVGVQQCHGVLHHLLVSQQRCHRPSQHFSQRSQRSALLLCSVADCLFVCLLWHRGVVFQWWACLGGAALCTALCVPVLGLSLRLQDRAHVCLIPVLISVCCLLVCLAYPFLEASSMASSSALVSALPVCWWCCGSAM